MQQISEIIESGIYEEIIPQKRQTIRDLLTEIGLSEELTFGILLNGKKASLDDVVKQEDKIVVIPHIKGGTNIFGKDITLKKGYHIIFFAFLFFVYISLFWNLINWFTYEDIMEWDPVLVVWLYTGGMVAIFMLFAFYVFFSTYKDYTEKQKAEMDKKYNDKIKELDETLKRLRK